MAENGYGAGGAVRSAALMVYSVCLQEPVVMDALQFYGVPFVSEKGNAIEE